MAWFIVGSPTVLPALNLMLDIPALALSLAAVALFLRVRMTTKSGGAMVVGLLTGLGIETKYTALLTPGAIILAGATLPAHRRRRAFRQAILALLVTAALVGAWEAFVASKYGRSHFVLHAARAGAP